MPTLDPGLKALLTRAHSLDADALVRFRTRPDGTTDAFVTTPFGVLASRRFSENSPEPAIYRVAAALAGDFSTPSPQAWPGALPPEENFVELDKIPVDVVHDLAAQGKNLARQFSGPMGPPKSLLDQTVLTVSGNGQSAEVSMRAIFTCTNLGLIPGIGSHPNVPRHLRVAKAGRWTRIDAPFGSVYQNQGLGLLF